jgi:hypothetical protein
LALLFATREQKAKAALNRRTPNGGGSHKKLLEKGVGGH